MKTLARVRMVVMGIVTSIILVGAPPLAVAVPVDAIATRAWSGTISVSHSEVFDSAGLVWSFRTNGEYRDLVRLETGASVESRYRAEVSLDFSQSIAGATYCGGFPGSSALTMTYSGPSTATVDAPDDNDIQFPTGDGTAFEMWDTAEGTFFYPSYAFFNARQTFTCPGWEPGRNGSGALSYQQSRNIEPETPLVDENPDPNRLVGTTTYTLATIPGNPAWAYRSYRYTISYDLTRGPTDDRDGDGIPDSADNCPAVANADQADLDGDRVGDVCDPDIDGDGLPNSLETSLGTNQANRDSDGDSIDDFDETNGGRSVDTDDDGTVDALDLDSDNDAASDETEGTGDRDADGLENYRDPDRTEELTIRAQYAYVGVLGLARGGSIVRLSGQGASAAQQVCFTSRWTGTVRAPRSSISLLWNGGPAANLDETTPALDGVFSVRRERINGGVRETVVLRYCTRPVSVAATNSVATYPLSVFFASAAGVPTKLEHDLRVEIVTSSGTYGPYRLDDESSRGSNIRVSWLERLDPVRVRVRV